MKGKLAVVNSATRQTVAILRWEGSLWRGVGEWEAEAGIRKRLEGIVAERQDLAEVAFSDMLRDGYGVRGWQGFSGWVQALGLALPAYGLVVDAGSIEWPFKAAATDGEADADVLEVDG